MMRMRAGLSLVEVLIGVVIVGVSALPILELVRSGTVSLEVTEVEAAARQLASDVLERASGPREGLDRGLSEAFTNGVKGQPVAWSQVLELDPSLKRSFPVAELGPLLDTADVRVNLQSKSPHPHAVFGKNEGIESYVVTVQWVDRNERVKKVTLARLVER